MAAIQPPKDKKRHWAGIESSKRFIANLLYFNKVEINCASFRLVFPNLYAGDLTYCLRLNSKRGDLLLCVGDLNLERDAFMRT